MSNFGSSYRKYVYQLEQINDAALIAPAQMVEQTEIAYADNLQNVARNICRYHRQARVAMLSGPSSSGKTTTAHLLKTYLEEHGLHTVIISLDDFYLGVDQAPLLPDGSRDLETPQALNWQQIQDCLAAQVARQPFAMPQFDFVTGQPKKETVPLSPNDYDFAIVEGLHALNPELTAHLPEESVVKIYVSVKQGIDDINGEVISPEEIRLARRIVRDMRTRGTPADGTIAMWQNVESGEDKYIRPYRHSADYTINSIHIYEPCMMRKMAVPILRQIPADSPCYRKARELEADLMRFEALPVELVPKNSMLREFLEDDE